MMNMKSLMMVALVVLAPMAARAVEVLPSVDAKNNCRQVPETGDILCRVEYLFKTDVELKAAASDPGCQKDAGGDNWCPLKDPSKLDAPEAAKHSGLGGKILLGILLVFASVVLIVRVSRK